jgi:hypothetical protein
MAARFHLLHGADKDFAPFAAQLVRQQLRAGYSQIGSGGLLRTLNDPGAWYTLRYGTDEGMALLAKNPEIATALRTRLNRWYAKHPSMKHRNDFFNGMTHNEINDWFRDYYREKTGLEAIDDAGKPINLFSTDPAELMRITAQRAEHVNTIADSIWSMADQYSVPASTTLAEKGWVPLEGILRQHGLRPTRYAQPGRKVTDATNRMLHPQAAQALQRIAYQLQRPDAATGIVRLFDSVMRIWKKSVVTWPESIARNMGTDLFANWLQGVRNPRSYMKAWKMLRGDPMGVTVPLPNGARMTGREILDHMDAAHARAAHTGPLAEADLGKPATMAGRVAEGAKTVGAKVWKATGGKAVFGKLSDVASFQSDFARVAHVVELVEKGIPIDEAIRSSKIALFDYAALTPWEKTVARRLAPFYSFFRFNTPFMVRKLVTDPGKISLVGHAQRAAQGALTEAGPLDTNEVPDWMMRRLVGLTRNDDDKISTFISTGIGLEDLAFWDRPVTEAMAMLNPILKATVQAVTKHDLWTDKDWDRGAVAPWFFKYAPQPLKDLIGFKPVVDKDGEESWYRADPFWMNILTALPTSRFMSTLQRFDASRPEAFGERLGPAIIKTVTGLRVGESDERTLKAKAVMEAMDAVLAERVAKGDVIKPSIFSVPRALGGDLTVEEQQRKREMARLVHRRKMLADAIRMLDRPEGQRTLRSGAGQ